MDMDSKNNGSPMTKLSGWTSSLPPPKVIGTKRALQFELGETRIRCYAQSRPYGGYKREETTSRSGVMKKAEFLKSKAEWSSTGNPSSIVSKKWPNSMGWTRLELQDTQCELAELLNLWQQDSAEQLSSSWADGVPTATCVTCV